MSGNAQLIHTFYNAFAGGQPEQMISCYHDDIRFEDPVFGELRGQDAKDMWRMLVRPGIHIVHSDVTVSENAGSAHWVAEYEFGKKKRPVINHIQARFLFKDNLIIEHRDHFDLWKWSRQAMGVPGFLLGWTPWMQKQIRKQVLGRLGAFQKRYQ